MTISAFFRAELFRDNYLGIFSFIDSTMGANDAGASGGPERCRRRGTVYAPGRYTEYGPPTGKGRESLCASPGPHWDDWGVPLRVPWRSNSGAPGKTQRKRKKPPPRPKSAPPTDAGASRATFRPIPAERSHSAPPLMTLSSEEVDNILAEVEKELFIAKVVSEFEQLGHSSRTRL